MADGASDQTGEGAEPLVVPHADEVLEDSQDNALQIVVGEEEQNLQ